MSALESRGVGDESAAYDPRAGWTAVTVFLLLSALAWLDRKIIAFMVGPLREALGATDFQISLLQGLAFVLFYSLAALPIGWAVDRFSRRRIIFWGIITWSAFAMAGGVARTYWHLLVARFGVGAGEASLHPAATSMLADLFPKHKLTTAIAVFGLGGILGSAISNAIGGLVVGFTEGSGGYQLPLLGHVAPWQMVFLITGAPGILMSFLMFAVPEPARRIEQAHAAHAAGFGGAMGFMWRNRRFYLPHFIGFSLVSIMASGFTAWTPSHFMRTYDLPVAQVGLTMAALQISLGAIGMVAPGFIIDRMMRRGRVDAHLRYFAWGVMLLGASGLWMALAPSAGTAFGALALVDLTIGFYPIAIASLQVVTPNQYRGQATAAFLIVYNIVGQGLGPSVVAGFTDFLFRSDEMVGASLALTFALCTPLAALCFWYGMRSMRRIAAPSGAG